MPAPGFVGADSFTYKATDGKLSSNTATVTINVTNLPPTVQAVSYTVPLGTAAQISAADGVLAGAADPYGLALTASVQSGSAQGSLWLADAQSRRQLRVRPVRQRRRYRHLLVRGRRRPEHQHAGDAHDQRPRPAADGRHQRRGIHLRGPARWRP